MNARGMAGFTLMEVMIVLAIVAILTVVAVGSYQSQTLRGNRSAAIAFMLEVANRQERFLLDNRAYATSLGELNMNVPAEVDDFYEVTVTDPAPGAPPSYLISAVPETGTVQTNDDCGTLTLNEQGEKTHTGGSRCWR